VFSERLSRVLMTTMDRAAAQSQVDDWCTQAVARKAQLREIVAEARPDLSLDDVFSLEGLADELKPVIEEELALLD